MAQGWILASQTFAVLTLIVCYLIGIPLLIYCLKTFSKHQHKAYFKKRNTKLFWVFSSILCIYILICGPMEALSDRGHLIKYKWYSPFATVMIQGIIVSALLLSQICRFWYIFVQIRVSQERAEWKKILNPNYESWVEKYYKYIKDWKYIVALNIVVPLSLLIIIVISVGESGSETWAGRTLMTFIFFCGVSQFLLFYLMKFVDYWYIRDEFGKYFYFLFIGIIFILIISGSGLLFSNSSIGYFNYIFITFISCFLFLLYLFYATIVIFILNENRSKKYKKKMITNSNGNVNETLTTKFKQFISTKEGYSAIMQHITREFSTETLLFLTVLYHFQQFLLEFDYLNTKDKFELIKYDSFMIPKDIPKPPIIELQTKKLRERKQIEQKLQRSKSQLQTDGNFDNGSPQNKSKRFSLHIKRNSDSLKKEALKQIFAFKKQSFEKLYDQEPQERTPSHSNSFETNNIEQEIKNNMDENNKNAKNNKNNNENNTNRIHIYSSMNKAMQDISPLPVESDDDIFTSSIDFSALIPIFDMMYRRFIVRGSAPMEINISYNTAEKLSISHRKMMSSHRYGMKISDWKELLILLKDAGKQTLRLLHDSYSRFRFNTNTIK